MKSGIDHLPPHKQRELERVVQIVFEEFEDALALATQGWKKKGRISKIILYGSYARGGWVDEPHTAKGYQSDYDLLIIVNDKRLTDRADYWSKLDDRLIRELSVTKTLRTPVNFIVHSLDEVNGGLSQGRYFFMDVARDGIALYQADGLLRLAYEAKITERTRFAGRRRRSFTRLPEICALCRFCSATPKLKTRFVTSASMLKMR